MTISNWIRSFKPCKVYIGCASAAHKDYVKKHKFTHVVHCVNFGYRRGYYGKGVKQISIKVSDNRKEKIGVHFKRALAFMNKGIESGDCKILVHCGAGRSRSSTIAILFFMCRTKLGFERVLQSTRKYRQIADPNVGFVRQLKMFEENGFQITEELQKAYENYEYSRD